ncbi:MAG: SoxR reducing system RseC family protein [Bacteroidales bacterium]|nr:SoxR reducing system RseC family protein [Bacteroidales bacterium]MCF8386375.1 SoxR reducing system RseC family protein [Bacteroidales bacterium]MCF8396783.1 SoxR reducing system RseC family protein [Bacteroidales bacterium]
MRSEDIIKHPGKILCVSENKVEVQIMAQSACASCHAKGHCSVADVEEKIVEVDREPGREFKTGDTVDLIMRRGLAPKAVFLGYLLPFLIVLITLFLLVYSTGKEGLSALISLGLLVPYYFIMYFMRDKLQKTFVFQIQ